VLLLLPRQEGILSFKVSGEIAQKRGVRKALRFVKPNNSLRSESDELLARCAEML